MAEPSDFSAMNLADRKKNVCRNVKRIHLKTLLVEIASAVESMVLPVDPNFKKGQTNDAEKSFEVYRLFEVIEIGMQAHNHHRISDNFK